MAAACSIYGSLSLKYLYILVIYLLISSFLRINLLYVQKINLIYNFFIFINNFDSIF